MKLNGGIFQQKLSDSTGTQILMKSAFAVNFTNILCAPYLYIKNAENLCITLLYN